MLLVFALLFSFFALDASAYCLLGMEQGYTMECSHGSPHDECFLSDVIPEGSDVQILSMAHCHIYCPSGS